MTHDFATRRDCVGSPESGSAHVEGDGYLSRGPLCRIVALFEDATLRRVRRRLELAAHTEGIAAQGLPRVAGRTVPVTAEKDIVFELFPPIEPIVLHPVQQERAAFMLDELFRYVGKPWPSTN